VASGSQSVVSGGEANQALGGGSTMIGGTNQTATGGMSNFGGFFK
jgi:hypothetical protein